MVNKQQEYFGGFQGRTNKLVDSCYTFWQGSSFCILQEEGYVIDCNVEELQKYVMYLCQSEKLGGFKDKPGKHVDIYHTMYSLIGLGLSNQIQKE